MKLKLTDPKRYPDPETEYETYDKDIVAKCIRIGDELKPAGKVARIALGHKYMTAFSKTDAVILRVPYNETITVTRTRQTKESMKRDSRQAFNLELIRDLAKDNRAGLVKAQAELNQYINDYNFADYQRLGHLMEEQAAYRVWASFEEAVRYCEKQDDYEGDVVSVFDEYCDELRKRLLDRYMHRSISRSSNVLSNLMEDVDRAAMAEFLDRNRWR